MNYRIHYERLISRARDRILDGYRERHHILPRCMGGGDEPENLVELTAREHWFAHKLLIFIYPDNRSLVHAAAWMAKRAANGRLYEWLRRRHAIVVSERRRGKKLSLAHRAKLSAVRRGKTSSLETRLKISAAKLGKKRPPFSPEWCAKISAKALGRKKSPETIAKSAAALRGRNLFPENIAKLIAANIGRKHTLETRAKMSASHIGKLGRPHSLETRAKISALRRLYVERRKASPGIGLVA